MKKIISIVFVLVIVAAISTQNQAFASFDKDLVPDIMKMSSFSNSK